MDINDGIYNGLRATIVILFGAVFGLSLASTIVARRSTFLPLFIVLSCVTFLSLFGFVQIEEYERFTDIATIMLLCLALFISVSLITVTKIARERQWLSILVITELTLLAMLGLTRLFVVLE